MPRTWDVVPLWTVTVAEKELEAVDPLMLASPDTQKKPPRPLFPGPISMVFWVAPGDQVSLPEEVVPLFVVTEVQAA